MTDPVAVGDVIAGKYRVDCILGKGGMGMVVGATHLDLRKVRAIKLMLPEANAFPRAIERFLREARAACDLTSEHVAHVFDVGRLADGTPFIVMEHLEGRDLADELARRVALPTEEAALYAIQVCEALAEAHARGIVHRDLKPGNLFLTSANDGLPHIKVLDFGLSKLLAAADDVRVSRVTTGGAVLGSPFYMSPEQIRADQDLDGRCDIWGLGVILYQLLTGRLPFDCGSIVQSIAMALERQPAPPSQQAPDIPPAIDAVILRCLEKRPADRYPDMAALARDLLPFAPTSAAPLVDRVGRVAATSSRTIGVTAGDEAAAAISPPISPRRRPVADPPSPAADRPSPVPSIAATTLPIHVPPSPLPAPAAGIGTVAGVVAERAVKDPVALRGWRRASSIAIGVVLAALALCALGISFHARLRPASPIASGARVVEAPSPSASSAARGVIVTGVAPTSSASAAPASSQQPAHRAKSSPTRP